MSYHEGLAGRFLIFIILLVVGDIVARDAQTVDKWAERIGSDILDLANAVARPEEIRQKYKELNARVEDKSGKELIDIISESVGRMLRRKMDAVRCILKVAEEVSESFDSSQLENLTLIVTNETALDLNLTYVSGKYSPVVGEMKPHLPKSIKNNSFLYSEMELTPDSHFYNIPVNTDYSAVHVPTNIYDLTPKVNEAIQWSKSLNKVFWQNYRSDPALSWQYFGSSTGILRYYPAMQWLGEESKADLYDCRMRSWYIESATCSKDMVILLDISGSMQGMTYTIAKATAGEILDTLSNNDFVTILAFNDEVKDVVPCFKDMLVQATPENIEIFKRGMAEMKLAETSNLTLAFDRAFGLLEGYRASKGCGPTTPCTQAIMLVTDGVPGNLTEVFEAWNWLANGTHIPVRIFTYLLGREVTKVREIQWMACLNRGYYSHVHTLSEVRQEVLKYIQVIARPLVLQEKRHPLIWTHAYTDISLGKEEDIRADPSYLNTTRYQEYRLLTSVSIPAYDRKYNRNNLTKIANLLGVAGTDVPLDEINRLTLPYKLGVNGYAFIVSNNGYVILHPDLRPAFKGELKRNYNSIDLTEVEIIDDNRWPRNPGQTVLNLRAALVNHLSGNMTGIPVKIHYDDYRRVTVEKRDYFYAPLPETPFGLAIALPDYGTTWIKVGDEIMRNQHMGVKIIDLFAGDRWRVHPTWVYCRFHYLEGHEFNSPEEEMRHFLAALDEPGWYWAEQYAETGDKSAEKDWDPETEEERQPDCGRKTLDDDAHYCNKELMQLLVFDARVTNSSFIEDFKYADAEQQALGDAYGVFLRFVATQSGLTRWQNLRERPGTRKPSSDDADDEEEKPLEFGDIHARAINEPWYKGAIFQHNVDPGSISLTAPTGAGIDAIVTVAQGIFPKDGGKEAPAAVVGFQMPMKTFYQRFIDVTSNHTDSDLTCAKEWIDCYLVDQNGYIVISDSHNDSGKFLGVIEGAIMGSMVHQGLYRRVEIYDYQALCWTTSIIGAAGFLDTPLRHLGRILAWFLARLIWLTSQFIDLPETWARQDPSIDAPDPSPPPKEIILHYTCDQIRMLYILEQEVADAGITNTTAHPSRPFWAEKVPRTNLVLVVIDTLHSSPYERLEVDPEELTPRFYTNGTQDAPCHKLDLNRLERRGLEGCYTDHPLENEITACGRGSRTLHEAPQFTTIILGFTIFFTVFY
ncbi:voltage-dependent calcium channel subunit alpha-2/delta-3 [Athalia rosae]|uniref:voltage-dependent calcium channel subunit alpha-2/delta-3 n=1 Tax=Athalia rosae TaxID=37344 RepID=UPI002034688C|nr:voltage-dependent calcium channel subunit alpha-2/delta-3 [Athalia rosae]